MPAYTQCAQYAPGIARVDEADGLCKGCGAAAQKNADEHRKRDGLRYPQTCRSLVAQPQQVEARAITMSATKDRSTNGVVVAVLDHPVWSRMPTTRVTADWTPVRQYKHDCRRQTAEKQSDTATPERASRPGGLKAASQSANSTRPRCKCRPRSSLRWGRDKEAARSIRRGTAARHWLRTAYPEPPKGSSRRFEEPNPRSARGAS